MSVKMKNLTIRPVLLRLNSGSTLHIAPRQMSGECTDGDVRNNDMIQKLLERRVLSIFPAKSQKKKTSSAKVKIKSNKKKE